MDRENATMDITWGKNKVFSISEKMFCSCDLNPPFTAYLKVSQSDFPNLIDREFIVPAPLKAKDNWIQINNVEALTTNEWESLIQSSYTLVKSAV